MQLSSMLARCTAAVAAAAAAVPRLLLRQRITSLASRRRVAPSSPPGRRIEPPVFAPARFSSCAPSPNSRNRAAATVAPKAEEKAPTAKAEAKARVGDAAAKRTNATTGSGAAARGDIFPVNERTEPLSTPKAKVSKAREPAKEKAVKAEKGAKAKATTAERPAEAEAIKGEKAPKAKASKAEEAANKDKSLEENIAIKELGRLFPKRHSSPLGLFRTDNINTPLKGGRKILLDKWNSASESTRMHYRIMAMANAEGYKRQVDRWLAGLTPQQKVLIDSQQFKKHILGYQARALHPARSAGPFATYYKGVFSEVSAKVKCDQPTISGKDLGMASCKMAAAQWRAMTAEQKKVYSAA